MKKNAWNFSGNIATACAFVPYTTAAHVDWRCGSDERDGQREESRKCRCVLPDPKPMRTNMPSMT